eukprot:NODE_3396_length_1226_cov_97.430644_g3222_i0.p1 GENE.NODE_3396_length_1226_cov_97.430644_g3222_i0~~NODE_3396_length_1226_cov_97.430644_g3222_i0.p1  ORF type:complete len:381 (+),score=119.68 NODE_3396_length_1226_cov_97.430644_g3222_i0:61-1143(+)
MFKLLLLPLVIHGAEMQQMMAGPTFTNVACGETRTYCTGDGCTGVPLPESLVITNTVTEDGNCTISSEPPYPMATSSKCNTDGSSYSYSESLSTSAGVRTIKVNGCPNHKQFNFNPNYAFMESLTYTIPSSPMLDTTAPTALNTQGGAIGITYSGGMVFSAYGGPTYGAVSNYSNSAIPNEGDTFDACGGHSSQTTSASYHYHVPPTCLLRQLNDTNGTNGNPSPQVGWAADGFPIYGPRGPGGVMMQQCTLNGNVAPCTDACGGYQNETGDGYKYRYYIMGEYNDGNATNTSAPVSPLASASYYPFTPICLNGCCPASLYPCKFGNMAINNCSSNAVNGTVTAATPAFPTGLPINALPK